MHSLWLKPARAALSEHRIEAPLRRRWMAPPNTCIGEPRSFGRGRNSSFWGPTATAKTRSSGCSRLRPAHAALSDHRIEAPLRGRCMAPPYPFVIEPRSFGRGRNSSFWWPTATDKSKSSGCSRLRPAHAALSEPRIEAPLRGRCMAPPNPCVGEPRSFGRGRSSSFWWPTATDKTRSPGCTRSG